MVENQLRNVVIVVRHDAKRAEFGLEHELPRFLQEPFGASELQLDIAYSDCDLVLPLVFVDLVCDFCNGRQRLRDDLAITTALQKVLEESLQ